MTGINTLPSLSSTFSLTQTHTMVLPSPCQVYFHPLVPSHTHVRTHTHSVWPVTRPDGTGVFQTIYSFCAHQTVCVCVCVSLPPKSQNKTKARVNHCAVTSTLIW